MRNTSRSRRLRKKLHIGEFQQFGFHVEFKLSDELTSDQEVEFWDAFIIDAIEGNQLTFGGGEGGGFVVPEGRSSGTDVHREVVQAWLLARSEVSSVMVGPLVDAWYPPDDLRG